MASAIVIGTLRANLTADSAQWTAGFRTAASEHEKFTKKFKANTESAKTSVLLMGESSMKAAANAQASARMIAGLSEAGKAAAAAQNAASVASLGWTGKLKGLATEAAGTVKATGLLSGNIGQLVLGFGSMAVIGTVTNLLTGFASRALDTAGRLSDLSSKTGLSTEALQKMEFVAEQTGGKLEGFAKASFNLGVRVEGGSKAVVKALQSIGLEHEKIKSLKPEQLWDAVTEALSKEENQQKANAAGLALFGKSVQEIMPAIRENYAELAKGAQISGNAQIAALDAAGDAWTRFKKNTDAAVTGFLGNLVLAGEALKNLSFGDKLRAIWETAKHGGGPMELIGLLSQVGTATQLVEKQTREAAKTAATSSKVQESYSQQLAKVKAELAALTPAQRKEIEAAQQLGVSQEELENKYGLTEGALRILGSQIKVATDSQKTSIKVNNEAVDAYNKLQEAIADVTADMHKLAVANANAMNESAAKQAEKTADAQLGSFNRRTQAERDAAETSKDIEEERAEHVIEVAKRTGANWQQIYAMEKQLADARLQRAIDQAEEEFQIRTSWIDRTTAFGEAEYQALKRAHDLAVEEMTTKHRNAEEEKREELRRTHSAWNQMLEQLRATGNQVTQSISRNFAEMLVGAQSFKEGFIGIWQSIKQSIIDILGDILNHFIKSFLKGMLDGITGQRGGFASALGGLVSGLTSNGGGPFGTATQAAGVFGGIGSGPGAGGGAAAGLGGLLTNPITAIAAGAAVLGGFIWRKGLFRGGEEALQVSPRRDRFFGQFGDVQNRGTGGAAWNLASLMVSKGAGDGGGPMFAALQNAKKVDQWESAESAVVSFLHNAGVAVQSFRFGGFVRPGVVMPAILHGGPKGEVIAPFDKFREAVDKGGILGGKPHGPVVVNVNVQAWDSVDTARWFRTDGIRHIKQAILLNTGGLGQAVGEAG